MMATARMHFLHACVLVCGFFFLLELPPSCLSHMLPMNDAEQIQFAHAQYAQYGGYGYPMDYRGVRMRGPPPPMRYRPKMSGSPSQAREYRPRPEEIRPRYAGDVDKEMPPLPRGMELQRVSMPRAVELQIDTSMMGNVESRTAQQALDGTLAEFDSSIVRKRVDEMWKLNVRFGEERSPFNVHLDQVADRYVLTKGFQLIRDELMLGFNRYSADPITSQACAADLSLPSVLTTCGYTNCGDRICQNAVKAYAQTVASRFASVTEYGEAKPEVFCPTGGGTDSGPTLAHVTVAHQIDKPIRNQIYNGNPHSYVLVNIDINTHCGHYDSGDKITFGKAQESKFRDARAACGAIVGTLSSYNPNNGVHVRLRADLGEENFEFLSNNKILADDGSDVTFLVAAAIVSVQGMRNTLRALAENELDERGLGHVTACVNVNNAGPDECLIYCARGTVFDGKIKEQGLGTDATKYTARTYVGADGKKKVKLLYGNVSVEVEEFMISTRTYNVNKAS